MKEDERVENREIEKEKRGKREMRPPSANNMRLSFLGSG